MAFDFRTLDEVIPSLDQRLSRDVLGVRFAGQD